MKSITLIGMPGAGKSTIGKKLAKRLDFDFIDLDLLIEEKEGKNHVWLIRQKGEDEFKRLEEKHALELDFFCPVHSDGRPAPELAIDEHGAGLRIRVSRVHGVSERCSCAVFSPGGSIIYSPRAMEKLCRETTVIYLDLPLEEIRRRLGADIDTRGIVGLKEVGLEGLYNERTPLYKKSASFFARCSGLQDGEIIDNIISFLHS